MITIVQKIKPLSINKAWQGRRFKTKDYKNYERDLLYILQKQEMIKGEVAINIDFYFKYPKKCDIDNPVKCLVDILVKKGYIEDDRKIMKMDLRKFQSDEEGFEVRIDLFES